MTSTHSFAPDWYSAPGQTVRDVLHHRQLESKEFALQMRMTSEELSDLLEGALSITEEIAERLSRVLGSTPQFWLAREQQYRADVKRLQRHRAAVDHKQWLRELPVADMVRFGWIHPAASILEMVENCLQFFNIKSPEEWRANTEVGAAFRASPTFSSKPGAVAAWLRQGEIQAAEIECARWDQERFKALLPMLRGLSRKKDPHIFIAQLSAQCAECGVAVVVVRAPNGCHASGATRFLSPDKAILMLSFRHLTDDQFWFTFFHEVGHLILHGSDSVFVEWKQQPSSKEETEANEFAANILVPPESRETMLALPPRAMAIIRFAHKVGVSPGIIVGQLQHHGRLERDELNFVKRRFKWG